MNIKFRSDTIVAISTPKGNGGIAVIRLSGANSFSIVDKVFRSKKDFLKAEPRKSIFGKIFDGKHQIDEVLVIKYISPASYTGEDLVEISCHGNYFVATQILELLLINARLADPGEFTQRAFINNKIDLTQAEAVGDILNAKTKYSLYSAIEQLDGKLHKKIQYLLDRISHLRTLLELEIDFLEQDLTELSNENFLEDLYSLKKNLLQLSETGEEGMILRDGLKISLVGSPNVGKSSIFNAFLNSERAIVTPIPGTTRDFLEEAISLNGYLIRIFDTAGIRQTDDHIEKIGIERSLKIIKESHLVLLISDQSNNNQEFLELSKIVSANKIISVQNKADLLSEKELEKVRLEGKILCSAISETGLSNIKKMLLQKISISDSELESGLLTNTRHVAAVKNAFFSLEKAIESFENELGFEFTAFDLKEASEYLEEIIGKITTDDLLNEIFANFCIGK